MNDLEKTKWKLAATTADRDDLRLKLGRAIDHNELREEQNADLADDRDKLRELLREALDMAPNGRRKGVVPGRTNGEREAYGRMQAALDEGSDAG